MGFGESATIKKVGIIKVDEENQMFQIKGAISNNGKKSGIIGKTFKGAMAIGTAGMSVAAGKLLGTGKTKVGSNDWYHFTDLISYELVENDNIVTSGGVGQALIAGAAFGGAGAIAGGITGKRVQKKQVESMYIKITLNNFDTPLITVPFITKKVKTTSKEYLTALEEANSLLATLDIIAHRK